MHVDDEGQKITFTVQSEVTLSTDYSTSHGVQRTSLCICFKSCTCSFVFCQLLNVALLLPREPRHNHADLYIHIHHFVFFLCNSLQHSPEEASELLS